MGVTNRYGFPQSLVSAVDYGWYRKDGHISVTSLLKSPRQRWLLERHGHEVVEDVSDRIWALLGSAVHALLQKHHDGVLVEERLRTVVRGWTLSGQADLLDSEMTLSDYKVCSVFSFLLGGHQEWEQQLNVYAWLYSLAGFDVRRVQIVGILRDWQQSKTVEADYPQTPVMVKSLLLWTREAQEAFVDARIRLHQESADTTDEALPQCSDEERWARPTTYAVVKPGRKSAVRVFASREQAERCSGLLPGTNVSERPGLSMRCERYCSVQPWCSQARDASR